MVLGNTVKVCFLYLLSTVFFSSYATLINRFSFDDIVFENDFSKAYKAAAKIFYIVHDSTQDVDTDFLLAKIWDFALKDFFYLKSHTLKHQLLDSNDASCFIQLHTYILNNIHYLSKNIELLIAVRFILLECNKLLLMHSDDVKKCNQYQDLH